MKKLISSFLVTILGISLFSQTTFAEFKDVDSKTEYFTAINWMSENEVINGYSDGNFLPNKCVNRAEFLKMLFKTLEIDTDTSSKVKLFTDTPADAWYVDFVKLAKSRGTIEGYPDGTFKADQCVTRAEAIKMATLEFNNGKIPEIVIGQMGTAYDVETPEDEENPWFQEYINYALSTNSLGTKHSKPVKNRAMMFYFYPDNSMSRKEVAEMLFRMKTIKDYSLDQYYDPIEIPNFRNMGFNIGVDYKVFVPISLRISDEKEKFIQLISELPEVQQKMENIYMVNSGEEYENLHRLQMTVFAEPTATDPDYKIQVGEDNGVSVVGYYIFYINKDTLAIKIIHPTTGELLTLEQWRTRTSEEELPSI